MFNFERGNVVSEEKRIINNTISSVVANISKKINPSTTTEQLYNLLKEEINNTKSKTTDITKQSILEKFKKDIVPYSTKLLERTVEAITAKSNSASNFYNSLPISILNELNLDSTRLQILPNNTLQNLSVKHLEKLPIEKLITLNIEEEKLKLLSPKTLQDLISTKTQELKGNIELKGNEGYLMINGEFIKADEFLSGFEFEKDSFKPIDPQIANEVQKIMYRDITVNNLDNPKLETNLSHSEQRMMLYILQKLEEQKQKRGEEIKEEDKIKEIVMFTGRKCCPVCHEALPKFMEHIKNKYGDLVPKTMTVYDFWNKKEYDGDFKNRSYLRNGKIITKPTDTDYKNNANNYYAYGSDKGVNYKSVFDGKVDTQHLSKFVNKINNHRCIGTNNTIGNPQYTVESLKGDSNVPIVFSVEELREEGIIDETTQKDIETLQQNLQIIISKLRENEKQLKELELKLENAKKNTYNSANKTKRNFYNKILTKTNSNNNFTYGNKKSYRKK